MSAQELTIKEGKIKWFGGYNAKTNKNNDYGFIESSDSDDIFVHESQVDVEDLSHLKENLIVTYKRFFNPHKNKYSAVEVKAKRAVDISLNKSWVLCDYCMTQGKYKISFVNPRAINLDLPDDQNRIKDFIANSSPVTFAKILKQLDICESESDVSKILNILLGMPDIVSKFEGLGISVWRDVRLLTQLVEYHGFLWEQAPDFIKAKIISTKYSKFFHIANDWKNYKPTHYSAIEISCAEAYQFTEGDQKLVGLWTRDAHGTNGSFINSTMYSARGAEKAAAIHYQARGFQILDTSIQQTGNLSEEWKLYDLKVGNESKQKLLDVKNARNSFSNKNRFSEFCVPRFKKRNNDEVRIVGVFSPYISDLSETYFGNERIVVLGETQNSALMNLQNFCNQSGKNLKITIQRTSYLKKQYLSEYLPPWLFDFDDDFYKDRYKIEERYRELNAEDIPPLSELSLLNISLLSLALCANQKFPVPWEAHLEPSIIRFSQILRSLVGGGKQARLNLSHLFLAVLIHFLENCLNPTPSFSPSIYRNLIWTDSPLVIGIVDPLSVIESMCNTLEKVWATCAEQITNFDHFQFDSRGLLKGRNKKTGHHTTIIAYCGGWKKDGQGKPISPCGNEPLHIGFHKTCTECKKLICNKCGFCSDKCEDLHMLKQLNERSEGQSNGASGYTYDEFEDF